VQHTEQHKLNYASKNDQKHTITCDVDGCDYKATEGDHEYDNDEDTTCNKCDYVREVGGGQQTEISVTVTCNLTNVKVGEIVNLTATVAGPAGTSQNVTWTIDFGDDVVELIDGNKIKGLKFGDFGLTATPEADATKAVTIENGHVSNATMYDTLAAREDSLIAEDFEDASKFTDGKLTVFGGSYNTAGVFYTAKNSTTAAYVKVENGKAVQVDPGDNEEAHTIISFGPTNGVIEGYLALTIEAGGNSWTPVQFVGTSAVKSNAEVLGLRTDGTLGLCYRLDGGNPVAVTDKATFPSAGDVSVYFKYDPATKKVTLKVDNHVYMDEVETTIESLSGIKLVSSTGGAKLIHLREVAVNSALLSVADYKVAAKAQLAAEREKYIDADYRESQVTALNEAVTAGEAAIDSEENDTYAKVDAALKAAKNALKAVKTDLALYKEEKIAEITAAKSEENYTEANWALVQTQVTESTEAINAATDKAGVDTAVDEFNTEVAKIPDNTTVSYDVTFVGTDLAAVPVISGNTVDKPEDPTAADVVFAGWYTDATYATEFDFENTEITAATSVYAKWQGVHSSVSSAGKTGITDFNVYVASTSEDKVDATKEWTKTSGDVSIEFGAGKAGFEEYKSSVDLTGVTGITSTTYTQVLKPGGGCEAARVIKLNIGAGNTATVRVVFYGTSNGRSVWLSATNNKNFPTENIPELDQNSKVDVADKNKMYVLECDVTGDAYVCWSNTVLFCEITVEKKTVTNEVYTGVTGSLKVNAGALDLSQLAFTVKDSESTVALNSTTVASKVAVTGFDAESTEEQTITITYAGKAIYKFTGTIEAAEEGTEVTE
ncbi:MAG: InlB B-repeat-containing protein, partial [Clostridia bacterium]|nr:InlB B-repeat-containing protein [Clostridia bacterium]